MLRFVHRFLKHLYGHIRRQSLRWVESSLFFGVVFDVFGFVGEMSEMACFLIENAFCSSGFWRIQKVFAQIWLVVGGVTFLFAFEPMR